MLRLLLALAFLLVTAAAHAGQPMRQVSPHRGGYGHHCSNIVVVPGNYWGFNNRYNRPVINYGGGWYPPVGPGYTPAYRPGQTSTVTYGNNRAYNPKPAEPLTINNPYFKK